MSNKAFQTITTNFQSNLDKYTNDLDSINVNIRDNQDKVSNYEILNSYDQNTLERMSSNTVNFNSPNNNLNYKVRQVPSSSNFFNPRNPSLDVGMSALPIQNMTILPNQLNSSLDLLAQTEITNMHKKSNLLDKSHIINSNELEESFDKFQGVAIPHIPYDKYDKPTSLFNNFVGRGTTDIIKEYICHINSIDRDINKYQNPFNFLVKCAPLSGETDASIGRTFENIRYIKLQKVILPRKYFVTKKKITNHDEISILFNNNALPPSNTLINISYSEIDKYVIIYSYEDNASDKKYINYTLYEPDLSKNIVISYEAIKNSIGDIITYQYDLSCLSIEDDKYTILYLNDINDISQFSTDITLSKAFNILYLDNLVGNNIYVNCSYVDKIYKFSDLGILTKMNIILTDSSGKQLSINIKSLDYNVPTINTMSCICKTDSETGNIYRDFSCICNYIRHPRYIKYQVDLIFKFGIIETDFDKRAFN
jgi:hypothetical protein